MDKEINLINYLPQILQDKEEYIKVFNSMIDAMSTSNIKEMVNADNALRNL